MDVPVVFAISGAIALLVGLLGGSIKAKEVTVKPLSNTARIITIVAGFSLIVASLWISGSLPTSESFPSTITPEPQNTSTPSPTNTPTPDPNVYIEDFHNGSKYWEISTIDNDDATLTRSIANDALRFQIFGKKSIVYPMGYPKLPAVSNFDMEATFTFIDGLESVEYGLMFRRTNAGSYRFVIDKKGYFSLQKYISQENIHSNLIDWQTPPEPLNKDGANKLRVYALGNKIKVYINGNLVGDITDDTFSSGIVDIISYLNEDEEITFDLNSFKLIILSP